VTEPTPRQVAAASLCRAVMQLARTAVTRLLLRDHDDGFLMLDERERAAMMPRAALFAAHVETLAGIWRLAERADPDGPLPVIAHASGGGDALLLMMMAAAPALDRAIARTYRTLEPAGLTVGLLLDLLGAEESDRLALAGALAADAPLRRHGLLTTPSPTALAGDPVALPASVVAALRGEPIAPPLPVDRAAAALDRDAARADLDRLGVAPLRSGELRLVGGGAAEALALAERLAAAGGCSLWMVSVAARPAAAVTPAAWMPLVRDAQLAGALVLIDLADADPAVAGALAGASRAAGWPSVALGSLSASPSTENQGEIPGE
jgi:winged helix domain-containing protein